MDPCNRVVLLNLIPCRVGLVVSVSTSHTIGREFASWPGHTKDHHNKSANALALCQPPSASFCSVLAGQWSSRIFTHDRYKILATYSSNLKSIYALLLKNMLKPEVFPCTNLHNSLRIGQMKMICKNYNNPS